MTMVGSMVARWLEYIKTNRETLDKIEMMYRETDDGDDVEEHVAEKCCISDCQCQLSGTCWQGLEEESMNDEEESVLREYQFRCGCSEVCFSFRGQKVGRSNWTFCDGSAMSRSVVGDKAHRG
eukprot:TRINITY_DN25770_c0_g1_i1.p1 TRINITY_DN25770_c0_g1~~TRINITY_DN25770_c0_g1_i1.p1  ORF type:complete len:123 (-),score=25.16 TRINITY_DN25770_c0_g1_i1:2-370(-)